MELTIICADCEAMLPVESVDAPHTIACGNCARVISLAVTEAVHADREVDTCPLCEGREFYIRKDFDPKVGLTVVIIGAFISAGFYWFGLDLAAYGVLGGAALIDLVVYGRLKDLTVCYRCHTEFRGRYARMAGIFDLHTADELELEWERKKATKFPRKIGG